MKNVFTLVLAALLGGTLSLAGYHFLLTGESESSLNNSQSQFAIQTNKVNQHVLEETVNNFSFADAAERALPSVVYIKAEESRDLAMQRYDDQNQSRSSDPYDLFEQFFGGSMFETPFYMKQGSGSGVIYSEDGFIVTNNHVIDFADIVEVTLFDNRKFNAEVVGKDSKTDLAVLKIEADDLPVLASASAETSRIGDWVLAIGNPFDHLTSTVTAGIISAKGRDLDIIEGASAIESFIQTDAAVNPGNSGGALVDVKGDLVGINTAIATPTGVYAGYSFAIPSGLMEKIADDIIEYGAYRRAILGVMIGELDDEHASELGLDITKGVVVTELVEGGSAQYAGIHPIDVIVQVDDVKIDNIAQLQEIIGGSRVGDVLTMKIYRKGEFKQIPVRLRGDI